jgi:L-ascorbate metabolism protein UlaG (beta-lactamase superfamily)
MRVLPSLFLFDNIFLMIHITHIDTACILLEINGYKILTDPTFDRAGRVYCHGYGAYSRKTTDPAIDAIDLCDVDLILLSHHQHKDNFDVNGRKLAERISRIISTKSASRELRGTIGLDNWESRVIETDKISNLKITATPAQHRPWWVPEFLSGEVIGFIIEFDGQEDGVIYISGDTVFFSGIKQVARRFKIDVGIFHVGAVQFRYLTGYGRYTMDSKDLIKAIRILNPNKIIPIHHKGWTHFKENESILRSVVGAHDQANGKGIFLDSGVRTKL